jgi:hypothetical protein
MKIRTLLKQLKTRWTNLTDPNYSDFKKVYPCIDTIPGFLKSPAQERWFFNTARTAPEGAVIVEIGSFMGRSTASFALACKGTRKHIYAIDLFEGDNDMYGQGDFQAIFGENMNRCGVSEYVTAIKSHSLEVAKKWERPVDILFIDGSHEYEDVKADFEAFYPYVKKGGISAFHDIKGKWEGVIRFWEEIRQGRVMTDFGAVSSLGFGRKA